LKAAGYETANAIQNSGTLGLMIVLLIVKMLIAGVLKIILLL